MSKLVELLDPADDLRCLVFHGPVLAAPLQMAGQQSPAKAVSGQAPLAHLSIVKV